MRAYTSGPWAWEARRDDAGLRVATMLVTQARPARFNDPVIFALREDWRGDLGPEREAAKRLIASAPELLTTLEALTEWACTHTSPLDPDSPYDLLVQARAVIARATIDGAPEIEEAQSPRP